MVLAHLCRTMSVEHPTTPSPGLTPQPPMLGNLAIPTSIICPALTPSLNTPFFHNVLRILTPVEKSGTVRVPAWTTVPSASCRAEANTAFSAMPTTLISKMETALIQIGCQNLAKSKNLPPPFSCLTSSLTRRLRSSIAHRNSTPSIPPTGTAALVFVTTWAR